MLVSPSQRSTLLRLVDSAPSPVIAAAQSAWVEVSQTGPERPRGTDAGALRPRIAT